MKDFIEIMKHQSYGYYTCNTHTGGSARSHPKKQYCKPECIAIWETACWWNFKWNWIKQVKQWSATFAETYTGGNKQAVTQEFLSDQQVVRKKSHRKFIWWTHTSLTEPKWVVLLTSRCRHNGRMTPGLL